MRLRDHSAPPKSEMESLYLAREKQSSQSILKCILLLKLIKAKKRKKKNHRKTTVWLAVAGGSKASSLTEARNMQLAGRF